MSIRLCNGKFSQIIEEKDKNIMVIIIKNFIKILPCTLKNEEFISIIHSKYEIFEDYIKLSIKKGWHETYYYLKSFMKCEIIYENYEVLKRLNHQILNFLLIYVENKITIEENIYINYKIAKISIKTLAYIMRYGYQSLKIEILRFLEKEILEAKSIYVRRLYLFFFKKSVKVSSITYLKDFGILENSFKFFNECSLVLPEFIYTLIDIYPLVSDDEKIKFVILSKLENLKKIYKQEDKSADTETIKAIKEFEKWYSNYVKNIEEYSEVVKEDKEKSKTEGILYARESNMNHEKNFGNKFIKRGSLQNAYKKTNYGVIKLSSDNICKKINNTSRNNNFVNSKKINNGLVNINLNFINSSGGRATSITKDNSKKNLDERNSMPKEAKTNDISQEKSKLALNSTNNRKLKSNTISTPLNSNLITHFNSNGIPPNNLNKKKII